MGKLLRSLHGENIRLYAGKGAMLAIAAAFLVALVISWTIAGSSGEENLLPGVIADSVNAVSVEVSASEPSVSKPSEDNSEDETEKENDSILIVISGTDISNSDISGSDMTGADMSPSDTDAPESVPEIPAEDDSDNNGSGGWVEAYRERYSSLTEMNEEYAALIENSSGSQRGYYIAKQQECIREAFIINHCLSTGRAAGHSRTWNIAYLTIWFMLLPVAVFASAAMASKTAGELKSGVMNTLYTLPATRLKQYIAKYLSVSIFSLLLCAAAWTGSLLGAMMGSGGMHYEGQYMRVLGESVVEVSFFSYSLQLVLCVFASVMVLNAFCAGVSTLTHSQGAAVALTAVLCVSAMLFGRTAGASGNIVAGLSIISVLDVSAPLRGIPNYASAGYIVSWLCALAHWMVFFTCGYIGMRRDTK